MYTALCAAPIALLIALLGLRTSRLRRRYKVMFGDGGHEDLARTSRAHGNAVEHFTVLVILLFLYESLGAGKWPMIGLGSAILASRVMHAIGMAGRVFPVQFASIVLTYALELALPGLVFVKALGKV